MQEPYTLELDISFFIHQVPRGRGRTYPRQCTGSRTCAAPGVSISDTCVIRHDEGLIINGGSRRIIAVDDNVQKISFLDHGLADIYLAEFCRVELSLHEDQWPGSTAGTD